MSFVNLHSYTDYGAGISGMRVEELVSRAAELGLPALAVADHNVMYALPALQAACDKLKADTGTVVKPLFGCELDISDDHDLDALESGRCYRLELIAKDEEGYRNLCYLSSARMGGIPGVACTESVLREHSGGLMALCSETPYAPCVDTADTPCRPAREGVAATDAAAEAGGATEADRLLELRLSNIFAPDDLYLHLDERRLDDELDLSDELHLSDDAVLQDARKALQRIADRCDFRLQTGRSLMPRFPLLAEGETDESRLYIEAMAGLRRRYGDPLPAGVIGRFEHEYEVICSKGLPSFFLIVAELVKWAKDNGISVGPGNGSIGGSLICYALGITEGDPVGNGLIFERFLSSKHAGAPDICLDFDGGRSDEVIGHCRALYGDDHVARILFFPTLKGRVAIEKAGGLLGCPTSLLRRIVELLPFFSCSLDEALGESEKSSDISGAEKSPDIPDLRKLYDEDADARHVIDAARSIEGRVCGNGVHGSALVICPGPVQEYAPVRLDARGRGIIMQYDSRALRKMGFLKLDFLEYRILSVISRTLGSIEATTGRKLDPEQIPLDDPAAFELFASGNTAGVYSFESSDTPALLKEMKPDRFSDITVLYALNRPSLSDLIPSFIGRKQGREPITCYDERLAPVLEETYGILVYQEQIMQIAMLMSGFSADEANRLHKLTPSGKTLLLIDEVYDWSDGSREEMREHFIGGAVRNDFPREVAERVWADILKLAPNECLKSQAIASSVLAMRAAWLKVFYPAAFLAALLTETKSVKEISEVAFLAALLTEMEAIRRDDGAVQLDDSYVRECERLDIPLMVPDINESGCEFTPVSCAHFGVSDGVRHNYDDGIHHGICDGIRFGLADIVGVDTKVARSIVQEREHGGGYRSFQDYLARMQGPARKTEVVRALVEGGAFDSLDANRGGLIAILEGRNPEDAQWNTACELLFEHGVLGRYVSGELHIKHAGDRPERITAELLARAFDDATSVYIDERARAAQDQLAQAYLEGRDIELLGLLYRRWDEKSPSKQTDAGAGNIMFKERMVDKDMDTIGRWAKRLAEEQG